ncbi:MAG TPA: hypothetical protein VJ140_07860, partial [Actinomycetota bacterium]|nr:hypothetical protein [Actinomycetota bacterium]
QGIVTRDSARQARLARRRKLRNLDVDTAGPRCGVCGLLEPHECLDGAMVRVNEPESFPVRRRS